MPTIQEPNVESIDGESEQQTQCTGPGDNDDDIDDDKSGHHRPNIGCDRLVKHSLMSKVGVVPLSYNHKTKTKWWPF